MSFKLMLGKVGIALIACNIPFFPFILDVLHAYAHLFHGFPSMSIVYSSFPSTMAAGFMLFIIGRKEFLDRVRGSRTASWLLTCFGLILAITSLAFLVHWGSFLASERARPEATVGWFFYLLLLAWGGFGSLSGVLWLVDGLKIGEDIAIPLKKEVGFEEGLKKYPKDLASQYVKQYPHNPTGVLEWHIQKKIKEGKTRERAVEELTRESD